MMMLLCYCVAILFTFSGYAAANDITVSVEEAIFFNKTIKVATKLSCPLPESNLYTISYAAPGYFYLMTATVHGDCNSCNVPSLLPTSVTFQCEGGGDHLVTRVEIKVSSESISSMNIAVDNGQGAKVTEEISISGEASVDTTPLQDSTSRITAPSESIIRETTALATEINAESTHSLHATSTVSTAESNGGSGGTAATPLLKVNDTTSQQLQNTPHLNTATPSPKPGAFGTSSVNTITTPTVTSAAASESNFSDQDTPASTPAPTTRSSTPETSTNQNSQHHTLHDLASFTLNNNQNLSNTHHLFQSSPSTHQESAESIAGSSKPNPDGTTVLSTPKGPEAIAAVTVVFIVLFSCLVTICLLRCKSDDEED